MVALPSADVLIVDDDAPTRLLFQILFNRLGLTWRAVGNGVEALRALGEGKFGAVLLDLFLPVMSGEEVLARLAESEPAVLRRIIVVTAASRSTADAVRERYRVRATMRKPVDITDLAAEVLDTLRERRVRPPRVRGVRAATPARARAACRR